MNLSINEFYEAAIFKPELLREPYSWVGHIPFAFWLIQKHRPSLVVELGVHTGNSYFAFCQSVLRAGLAAKCYAIDTWDGDKHSGEYSETVFKNFIEENNKYYKEISYPIRSTFNNALPLFENNSIDLLHIDGLHTYDAVKHDFESWFPKLSHNAIVLFHDIVVDEKDFGVKKFWAELKVQFPKNIEFSHSHGLGVLQLNGADSNRDIFLLDPKQECKRQVTKLFETLGNCLLNAKLVELLELKNSENLSLIKKLDENFYKHDLELLRHQKIISDLKKQKEI